MDSMTLYTDYFDILEGLTDAQLGRLMRALSAYCRCGEVPELEPMSRMAFAFIRRDIDKAAQASRALEEKAQRLRNNGRKGGAPKGNKNAEKNNQEQPMVESETTKNNQDCFENNQEQPMVESEKEETKQEKNKEERTKEENIKEKRKEEKEGGSTRSHASTPPPSPKFSVEGTKERLETDPLSAEIMELWNSTAEEKHLSVRRVTMMTKNRQSLVRRRLKDCGGDAERLKRIISDFVVCPFANGDNREQWVANLEWTLSDKNFINVSEGVYSQTPQARAAPPGIDLTAAIAESKAAPQKQDERERILGMIHVVRRNPKGFTRKALEEYRANGTLARLGIVWEETSPQTTS